LRTIQSCIASVAADESENAGTVQKQMAALSVCLSYHPLLTKFETTRRDLLLGFHRNSIEKNNHTNPNHTQQQVDMVLEVEASVTDPQPMEIVEQCYDEKSSWFSQKRMIRNILQEFSPECSDASDGNKKLFQLLDAYRESTQIDDRTFLELATCMHKWCMFVDDSGADTTLSSESSKNENPIEYTSVLTKWAIEASSGLKNPNSKALLATILLSSSSKGNSTTLLSNESQAASEDEKFERWYTPLADIIRRHSIDNDDSSSKIGGRDLLLEATMENLRSQHVQRLLCNLLGLTKSHQQN